MFCGFELKGKGKKIILSHFEHKYVLFTLCVIKIDPMRKYIDFSIEKKRLVKKLCFTKTYGSRLNMNLVILILAFLAVFSNYVAGEYSGKSQCENSFVPKKKVTKLKRKIFFFLFLKSWLKKFKMNI